MLTGRAGLGPNNKAGLRNCSFLVPITDYWLQGRWWQCVFQEETAVLGMPRFPRRPLSAEPRGIGHLSGSSAAAAAAAVWSTLLPPGMTDPGQATAWLSLLTLPCQQPLWASSVPSAAESLCAQTWLWLHLGPSESIFCGPLSALLSLCARLRCLGACLCLCSAVSVLIRVSVPFPYL